MFAKEGLAGGATETPEKIMRENIARTDAIAGMSEYNRPFGVGQLLSQVPHIGGDIVVYAALRLTPVSHPKTTPGSADYPYCKANSKDDDRAKLGHPRVRAPCGDSISMPTRLRNGSLTDPAARKETSCAGSAICEIQRPKTYVLIGLRRRFSHTLMTSTERLQLECLPGY